MLQNERHVWHSIKNLIMFINQGRWKCILTCRERGISHFTYIKPGSKWLTHRMKGEKQMTTQILEREKSSLLIDNISLTLSQSMIYSHQLKLGHTDASFNFVYCMVLKLHSKQFAFSKHHLGTVSTKTFEGMSYFSCVDIFGMQYTRMRWYELCLCHHCYVW